MNSASRLASGGFAFTEVLIGAGIMIAVGAACLGAQLAATNLMNESAASAVLEERAIFAANEIAFETRWADGGALLLSKFNGSDRIDLRIPVGFASGATVWSTTITYRVVPSPVDSNSNGVVDEGRLVRIQGTTTRVLCDDVVPGGFTATRVQDNVAIQVRLLKELFGRPIAVTAATSVTIRN
ncbi:MAG TPA: hypothetical protein VF384_03020 [Planctomycetota bacterium]